MRGELTGLQPGLQLTLLALLCSCGAVMAHFQQMLRRLLEASLTLKTPASLRRLLRELLGCGDTKASGCKWSACM